MRQGVHNNKPRRRATMCYEERYYSEWTRRTAQKREEPKPAAEPRKPEVTPDRERKPAEAPVVEHETATAVE
jgi:hypothetical protein